MNAQEALTLCRLVKAACPQQAMDEFSPDAWHLLLEPYRLEDCKQAVVDIVRTQPFVAPAEVIARVKAIRAKRIDDFGPIDPPREVEDGTRDYHEWLATTRRTIADGDLTAPPRREINRPEAAKVRRAIAGTFPTIPRPTEETA